MQDETNACRDYDRTGATIAPNFLGAGMEGPGTEEALADAPEEPPGEGGEEAEPAPAA